MRMEPPPSDPVARGTMPAASAAAAPPDEPPAPLDVSNGFRVGPKMALVVFPIQPNSGVLVLPTTMQPAALSRATDGAVGRGRWVVLVQGRSVGRRVADRILEILDADRDAGEGSGVGAACDAVVEGGGVGEGPLPIHGYEGVVGRVVSLDPIQGFSG